MDPVSPPEPSPPSSLNLQIKTLKVVVAFLVAAIVGASAYLFYLHKVGSPVQIALDGKTIATVRSAAVGERDLRFAEATIIPSGYSRASIVRLQRIQFVPADPGSIVESDMTAEGQLAAALKIHVRGYAIFINGRPVMVLPTDDEATQTLETVKSHWTSTIHQNLTGPVGFVQDVEIVKKSLPVTEAYSDGNTAAPTLWQESPVKTVTVEQGDTGYKIAHRNRLSFAQFLLANAGKDINHLKPGQLVNIQSSTRKLTVRCAVDQSDDERILASGPKDAAGVRRIEYSVTLLNGVESSRRIISMKITQPAKARSSL